MGLDLKYGALVDKRRKARYNRDSLGIVRCTTINSQMTTAAIFGSL